MHGARTIVGEAERHVITAHIAAEAGPRYDHLLAELRREMAIIEAAALLTGGMQGSAVVAPSYTSSHNSITTQGCCAIWPSTREVDAAALRLLAMAKAAAPRSATIIPFPSR